MHGYIRSIVERRCMQVAKHLGLKPEELIEQIEAYTIEGTILGDRTGATHATACQGDATAAGDGTSGDHVAIEPNQATTEWLVLGVWNFNSAGETETWGLQDFFAGSEKVTMIEHDADSSLDQRRVNAQAFSVSSAEAGCDGFPYAKLPTAKKDAPLRFCHYNIAGASAEQTFTEIYFYVPVPPGKWNAPGGAGICRPCACR